MDDVGPKFRRDRARAPKNLFFKRGDYRATQSYPKNLKVAFSEKEKEDKMTGNLRYLFLFGSSWIFSQLGE